MLPNLFRQQAIKHQQQRLHGEVMVVPGFPYVICTLFLFLWISVLFVWLLSSQYARKETVSGWLEPPAGVIRVFPDTNQGSIESVLVSQGQTVEKNQPLIIVSGDRYLTTGESLESTLTKEYQQQSSILQQQLNRTEQIHHLQVRDLRDQIEASRLDLSRLSEQINTLKTRYDLQQKQFENYSTMYDSGHLSDIEMNNSHQQLLALQNEMQKLLRDKINQRNSTSQLSTQLTLAPQIYQNQRTQLQTKISELKQQIEQLNSQRTYVLRASRAGIVTNLQAIKGQQVNVNTPMLSLLPLDNQIEAKLLVPVRAVGFVKASQAIEIRYDAFPYQKFGLYSGEIANVSDSVILPGELGVSPIPIKEPVYLVRAQLAEQFVSGYGQSMALKSGMTLSADIKLANRSVMEWLLEPIYSLRGKL